MHRAFRPMLVINESAIRGKRGALVCIAGGKLTQVAAVAVGDPDVDVPALSTSNTT